MQHGIDIITPQRPGPFPVAPPAQKRGMWGTILPIAGNILLVALLWAIGATGQSPAFCVSIGLTWLFLATACWDVLCRRGGHRAIAALALNVDSAVRTYTEGATPMFEIDEAVAHALTDPWHACGGAAARLSLYVMHSPPAEAGGSIARAVYTRDQAERIWPHLFSGPTARQDRRRLFNYTVRIPTTRRIGVSPVGDVCIISVHTALHPVDAFAYALDAGVAAKMAADRLVQSRLQEEHKRRLERQKAICDEEERQTKASHPTKPSEAQQAVQPPPSLFVVPPMTH
ncbi:hypothetical protein pclt_cds_61 [Pandoravirus celtis]|uniref:Uncharacterized protein n=1 Tax=Pandoravirus celtis TaxID=2568002 RepID=A0A4D6EHA9_9VIRU|nr:hypothetical protein pclt_cds_61 [Pandoravirus celtis]